MFLPFFSCKLYATIPSLTLKQRQKLANPLNSLELQAFFLCIDMCYFFFFVLVFCFVALIMLRIDDFEMNSKSVLKPKIACSSSVSFVRL